MVTIKVKAALRIKDRTIGLIGHNKIEPVIILTRFGIHTFGLKFPIDVLILDKNDQVVKLMESLKINRLFFWPVKYNKVLELPAGFVKKNKIELGDKIILKII